MSDKKQNPKSEGAPDTQPTATDYTKLLKSIDQKLSNINQKGFDFYEEDALNGIHCEMKQYLDNASRLYNEFIVHQNSTDWYKEIQKEYENNKNAELGKKQKDIKDSVDNLLSHYSKSTYTLRSAFDEIFYNGNNDEDDNDDDDNDEDDKKKLSAAEPEELLSSYLQNDADIRMIQLCKNVRTIEDMLNRICTNNIDKSIVKGERHFVSMKNGFKWLFSQSSPTFELDSERQAYQSVDIRDKNRFLDFLKYQIVTSFRYIENEQKDPLKIEAFAKKIENKFLKSKFEKKQEYITNFKDTVSNLIDQFFEVYTVLSEYRDLVFKEEEIKRKLKDKYPSSDISESENNDWMPTAQIVILSAVLLRALTDRFVSFVKINDLNFGNSTFNRSWFNYSELSDGNYAGSSFQHVRIENAIVRRCDLSTSDFSDADLSGTDFSGSNFNYSNLTGTVLDDAVLNNCQFQSAIFRDYNLDSYNTALNKSFTTNDPDDPDKISPHERNIFHAWNNPANNKDYTDSIMDVYLALNAPITELQKRQSGAYLDTLSLSLCFKDEKDEEKDESKDNSIYQNSKKQLNSALSSIIPPAILNKAEDIIQNESVDEKNEREREHGRIRFKSAVLSNASMKQCQMSGADLSHLNIRNVSFENSDISNSVIYYTPACSASFMKTNLIGTKCFESDFSLASFDCCAANNASFINCNLQTTNWNKAILINATFFDATHIMEDIARNKAGKQFLYLEKYFKPKDKQAVKISPLLADYAPVYTDKLAYSDSGSEMLKKHWQSDCSLNDSKMETALMDNAKFLNIRADKSSFKNSSMKNVILANCSMHLTDFINADMRYSYIALSSLGDDNFTHANITKAKIQNTEFCNSNFTDVLLNSAELNHVLFSGANLEKLNVTKATFCNCAFIDCNIDGMILQNATFKNCVFEHLDFTNLVAKRTAKFENCIVSLCRDDDTEQSLKYSKGLTWLNNTD